MGDVCKLFNYCNLYIKWIIKKDRLYNYNYNLSFIFVCFKVVGIIYFIYVL